MAEASISEELRGTVRQIVADVLEIDPYEIGETGNFVDDYEADSLLIIQMVGRLERTLGIRVPPEEAGGLTDLRSAYNLVARYSGSASAPEVSHA